MPISYKSTVHKPIDYVQPVDLNLLGKVLQYKQGEFDAGTNKVQGTLDSIASMDMVKGADKDYLNSKLSNLVSTINNIGGADFSDPNITNQIAGLSSQIYGDDKVVNAVANTKRFRYVQSYYKDLKEKKPKEWNPANEWYDMNKFSNWLQDGQVGTSPTGDAGSVSPYHDYEGDWTKMFDKVANAANITTTWTDKGLMYMKDGKKEVSPDRIWATASMLLTPQQRAQIGIEGRYQYQNLPISELTKAYDSKLYQQVGEATNQLSDYKAKLKGATTLKDQQDYRDLISDKEGEINKLIAPIKRGADEIKEKLYLDEKLKGLASRYAFTQTTSSMQAASDKMFNLKYKMDSAKFAYAQGKDKITEMINMADKGLMWDRDSFGNPVVVEDPSSSRTIARLNKGVKGGKGPLPWDNLPLLNNSMEEQQNQFDHKTLDNRKNMILQSNKDLFHKFVQDMGRKMGWTDTFIQDLSDDGFLQTKVNPDVKKMADGFMESWNAMTRGENINYDKLDPLFKAYAGKFQENAKEAEAIDKYYDNVNHQVMDKYGVTPDQYDKYQQYTKAYAEYQSARASGASATSPDGYRRSVANAEQRLQQTIKDIGGTQNALGLYMLPFDPKKMGEFTENRSVEAAKLMESGAVRFNLPAVTITDDKDKNLAKMVSLNANTLNWFDTGGKPRGKMPLNVDNIEPMSIGYDYIKGDAGTQRVPVLTFKNKTGSKAENFTVNKVPLTPEQAQALGFGKDVHDIAGYRLGLHLNGEVKDVNTTSGKNYELKYDIVKYDPSNENDESVFLRVHNGQNIVSLYNRPFPSYEQAMQFAESMTKQKSQSDAISLLDQLAQPQ